MDVRSRVNETAEASVKPAWGAVLSMGMGVFALVTAEFLPASLLTPMAGSLGVTEGQTGQAVTATAVVALFTSLFITAATRGIDRRRVLLAFSALLIVSNLLVAFAPGLWPVLAGRVLLGVALGGFWTMAAAITMRLVPEPLVPRALSVIFSGVSLATIAAAPLGSYFGAVIGWRNVFLAASVLGVLALIGQWWTLPSLAPRGHARLGTLVELLGRPRMGLGMVAIILVFTGHFAFFTYLRPFLEGVARLHVDELSAVLLGFGLANFAGTSLAGYLLARNLHLTLWLMPLAMGGMALMLVAAGQLPALDCVLVASWGMAFGAVPVAWSTWITRSAPDEAESGGGLLVAAIQLAIGLGAAAGGLMFDSRGANGVFAGSALVLLAAVAIILPGLRMTSSLTAE